MKEKLFEVLKGVQRTYPELRLGQLIVNAVPAEKTLFYVTDEELCEYLEDYMMKRMYNKNP